MGAQRILVVDDEENLRHFLSMILEDKGYYVGTAEDGAAALRQLEKDSWDIVLCDIRMPHMDGIALLQAVQARGWDPTIIMMSAYGTMETAIEAMKLGAYDYVSKPFNSDEIILTLRKAEERERLRAENTRLRREVEGGYTPGNIIGRSPAIRHIRELIEKVGGYRSAVLISGESGTGKELVAKAVHYNGRRKHMPIISVNCTAIPENLIESELFGHVKGAFTDAVHAKDGLFKAADGGTLFLDEIGELPLNLQVKLLRVLQDNEVRPVGDTTAVPVDVRVIAATGRAIEEEVEHGRFREDLYYRLNVVHIYVPPLRERTEDIPALVDHFITYYNKMHSKDIAGMDRETMERCMSYQWPGNVRELENAVERAVVLADDTLLHIQDLPEHVRGEGQGFVNVKGLSIKQHAREMEMHLIKRALKATGGNRARAARLLDISRVALIQKIKQYGLENSGSAAEA